MFDGLAHRVLNGGVDGGNAVDDPGHGGTRDAGLPCDILQRGGPSVHARTLSVQRSDVIERSLEPRCHTGTRSHRRSRRRSAGASRATAPARRSLSCEHLLKTIIHGSVDFVEPIHPLTTANFALVDLQRATICGTPATTLDAVFTRMKHASARERSPHLPPFTF